MTYDKKLLVQMAITHVKENINSYLKNNYNVDPIGSYKKDSRNTPLFVPPKSSTVLLSERSTFNKVFTPTPSQVDSLEINTEEIIDVPSPRLYSGDKMTLSKARPI